MTETPHSRRKDLAGGLLLAITGAAVALRATHYSLGTLNRMGPGYFPLALGVLLAVCGVLIVINALFASPAPTADAVAPHLLHGSAPGEGAMPAAAEATPAHAASRLFDLRVWLCLLGGIAAFVLLGKHTGLLPASFAIVFISAFGDRENTWRSAGVLALAITGVAWLLFGVALKLNMPLFTWA